ncbi:MAG TPA: hypothetical protein VHQ65_10860 [Thermoanaerobaculia bacterium]|nr:hypothetical protein [Thermoanaerobaculia bacterium]
MMRRDAMRWLAWTVLVLLVAGEAAAQGRRDRGRQSQEVQRFETALGIQVREGRRPRAGVEVALRPEGQADAPALTATTDAEGQAVVWGLAPGVWRLELSTRDETDFVVSVRVLPERRAEQVGAAARDVDAPDLRWRFFRVTEAPPVPVVRRPEPAPVTAAPPSAAPARPQPPPAEPEPTEPVPQAPPQRPAPPEPAAAAAPPEEQPADEERPPEPAPSEIADDAAAEARPTTAGPQAPPAAEPVAEPDPEEPAPEPADEPVPAQRAVPGLVAEGGTQDTGEARPAEPAYEADEPADAEPANEPTPHLPVPEETLVRTPPEPSEPSAATLPPGVPPSQPPPAEPPPSEPQPREPQAAEPPVQAPELPRPPVLEQEIPPAAAPPRSPSQPPTQPPTAVERPEPPQAPMPPQPPEFRVRSSAAGDCDECREGEGVATVARTVAPGGTAGGAECAAGMAAAALSAARGQVGPGAPQPLDGAGVAPYTAPGAACQVFGIVLPPGAVYRGFEYRTNGQWCAPEGECARVPGVVWPARPVIRELEGGATLVYGVLRNTSGVPQRGELAVFYIPAP